MSRIVVDDVAVDEGTLRSSVTVSPELRRFFSGSDLVVRYGVDVSDVPRGILSIPVLAHVCPVAWTRGADVVVDCVDSQFADGLPAVRDALGAMYPTFMQGGRLVADRVAEPPSPVRVRSDDTPDPNNALLFTGGVDSMYSYVRTRELDPTLVGVRGWTILDDEDWRQYRSYVGGFAAERGLETRFVRSNMLSFLDHAMLLAHYKRFLIGGWYSGVGSGIGMLGLLAPLAYTEGYEQLRMASSHWEGIALPWGSHPVIDENVAWTGTRCFHDGYERTRQEKLEAIGSHVERVASRSPVEATEFHPAPSSTTGVDDGDRERSNLGGGAQPSTSLRTDGNGRVEHRRAPVDVSGRGVDTEREPDSDLELRVCNDRMDGNCGTCPKCCRTAIGLVVAGHDPAEFGFPFDDRLFDHVRHSFDRERWLADEDTRIMWEDIRAHVQPEDAPSPAAAEFYDWVLETDFAEIVANSRRPASHRFLRALARHTPEGVYSRLYPLYELVKTRG